MERIAIEGWQNQKSEGYLSEPWATLLSRVHCCPVWIRAYILYGGKPQIISSRSRVGCFVSLYQVFPLQTEI